MDRYRLYVAWQEAMKLGLTLYHLADDLPDEEQHLLAADLRRAAVEVPSGIAQNLLSGQAAELYPMIKLQVAMELIGKVYPALDTLDAERGVAALADRLNDPSRFMETVPQPAAPEPIDEEDDADEDEDDDEDQESEDGEPEVHIGVSQE